MATTKAEPVEFRMSVKNLSQDSRAGVRDALKNALRQELKRARPLDGESPILASHDSDHGSHDGDGELA